MRKGMRKFVALPIVIGFLTSSCSFLSLYSHANDPAGADPRRVGMYSEAEHPGAAEVASETVPWSAGPECRANLQITAATGEAANRGQCDPRKNSAAAADENFVALALSGGGSRAAVFSAQVLFELERYGVTPQLDVISSVSGGSYTAALYALSCDPGRPCPDTVEGTTRVVWSEGVVFGMLERNFISRWIWSWFWPENMVRYWATDYDRSDIMAETLADNLFDTSTLGNEPFRFQDLNPQRPNLVINATDNTFVRLGQCPVKERTEQLNFTFTVENFACLNSTLASYPIANAVVASSAFPGAFNYVTLAEYPGATGKPSKWIHLMDAGASDNLGVTAISRMLTLALNEPTPPRRSVVFLADAFVQTSGKYSGRSEPRGWVDYFVDTNVSDAFDTTMDAAREDRIDLVEQQFANHALVHLTFGKLDKGDSPAEDKALFRIVNKVPTDLRIAPNDAACLRVAARRIVELEMGRLRGSEAWRALQVRDPPAAGKPLPACNTAPPSI